MYETFKEEIPVGGQERRIQYSTAGQKSKVHKTEKQKQKTAVKRISHNIRLTEQEGKKRKAKPKDSNRSRNRNQEGPAERKKKIPG